VVIIAIAIAIVVVRALLLVVGRDRERALLALAGRARKGGIARRTQAREVEVMIPKLVTQCVPSHEPLGSETSLDDSSVVGGA
jgi:hypothetical protein